MDNDVIAMTCRVMLILLCFSGCKSQRVAYCMKGDKTQAPACFVDRRECDECRDVIVAGIRKLGLMEKEGMIMAKYDLEVALCLEAKEIFCFGVNVKDQALSVCASSYEDCVEQRDVAFAVELSAKSGRR